MKLSIKLLAIVTTTIPLFFSGFVLAEMDSPEKLYSDNCAICHAPGEMGTMILGKRLGKERSVLATRDDLAPEYVKHIVRNGLMGMPLFTRGTVDDEELEAIVGYLIPPKKGDEK